MLLRLKFCSDLVPEKDYSFGEAWKDGFFDLNKLTTSGQDIKYLHLFGFSIASSSKIHEGPGKNFKKIMLSVNMPELINYVKQELKPVDYTVSEYNHYNENYTNKGYKRPVIYIWIPAIMYHYVEPLPRLGPKQRKALLDGVLTKCVGDSSVYMQRKRQHFLREKLFKPEHEKILFLTRNERFHFEVRLSSSYRPTKIPWYEYNRGESLGTWYPDPSSLKDYMLFDSCQSQLERLHQFDNDEIALEISSLKRAALFDKAKELNVMPLSVYRTKKKRQTELHNEARELRGLRDNLENRYKELTKNLKDIEQVEKWDQQKEEIKKIEEGLKKIYNQQEDYDRRMDELHEELHGKPRPPKHKINNSYRDRQYKHLQALHNAGER